MIDWVKMDKEEKLIENAIVTYTAIFDETFILPDDIRLILDSIEVYSLNHALDGAKYVGKRVEFNIIKINGKTNICPVQHYDSFLLYANRLVETSKVIICNGNKTVFLK